MHTIFIILSMVMVFIFLLTFLRTCRVVREYYKKHNEEKSIFETIVWVGCTEYTLGSVIFMFGWYQAARALSTYMFDSFIFNGFIMSIFAICSYQLFVLYMGAKAALKKIESGDIDDQE